MQPYLCEKLEGFSVNGPVSLLVVLPLGDPHLLEGVQRGEDGASDPRGVEALLRRRDADLDVLGGQLLHLGEEAVAEALEEIIGIIMAPILTY